MFQQNNDYLKFDNPELFNKQEQVIITQTPDIPDSLEKKIEDTIVDSWFTDGQTRTVIFESVASGVTTRKIITYSTKNPSYSMLTYAAVAGIPLALAMLAYQNGVSLETIQKSLSDMLAKLSPAQKEEIVQEAITYTPWYVKILSCIGISALIATRAKFDKTALTKKLASGFANGLGIGAVSLIGLFTFAERLDALQEEAFNDFIENLKVKQKSE